MRNCAHVLYNSLDDFIDLRLGRGTHLPHMHPLSSSSRINQVNTNPNTPTTPTQSSPYPEPEPEINPDLHSRSARIRAFRAFQSATPEEREKMRRDMEENTGNGSGAGRGRPSWKAVHLMSAEEVRSLFGDIVEGLAFLVS